MAAGSKIKDTEQKYHYSNPWLTTPSGHQVSFYDTPGNARVVIRHTSGSHIEFKDDGSVFVKAVGDLHTQTGGVGGDTTTQRNDQDLVLDLQKVSIRCNEFNLEIGSTGRVYAGTDFITQANNLILKSTESISLEGTKSLYVDTKEYRERIVSRRAEVGTKEDSGQGGINVTNVYGNAVIQNDDPNGGITISSKGYLNLVCGQERVDITGKYTDSPEGDAKATYTNIVYGESSGQEDVSTKKGDYYMETDAGVVYKYAKKTGGSTQSQEDGLKVEIMQGDHTHTNLMGDETHTVTTGDKEHNITAGDLTETVGQDYTQTVLGDYVASVTGDRTRTVSGNETVNISGTQTITAARIFLN